MEVELVDHMGPLRLNPWNLLTLQICNRLWIKVPWILELGSHAGPVNQANGMLSFKDDLKFVDLLYCDS